MTQDTASILVVDDEKDMRQLLQDILEEDHYRVVGASDGQEALAHMESEKFLVVVTDLRMKGLDGLGLLEQVIHKHPESNLHLVKRMTRIGKHQKKIFPYRPTFYFSLLTFPFLLLPFFHFSKLAIQRLSINAQHLSRLIFIAPLIFPISDGCRTILLVRGKESVRPHLQ